MKFIGPVWIKDILAQFKDITLNKHKEYVWTIKLNKCHCGHYYRCDCNDI